GGRKLLPAVPSRRDLAVRLQLHRDVSALNLRERGEDHGSLGVSGYAHRAWASFTARSTAWSIVRFVRTKSSTAACAAAGKRITAPVFVTRIPSGSWPMRTRCAAVGIEAIRTSTSVSSNTATSVLRLVTDGWREVHRETAGL